MPGHQLPLRAVQSFRYGAIRSFTQSRVLRGDDDGTAKNYYEALNVQHDASPAEIKKSFYALSKTHHPDHNRNDPTASRKFHRIAEAYSVLGTPAKRAAYDRDHGHQHPPHRSGSYHSTGPAGGRTPSGLSRRRGTYQGPPPSFFRSGGWGQQSAKRKAAHEDSTGGGGTATAAGMGPGQDPFGHKQAGEVPHFDRGGHERTHQWQDHRRATRVMGHDIPTGPQESQVGMFFAICGILVLTFTVPIAVMGGFNRKKKADKKSS